MASQQSRRSTRQDEAAAEAEDHTQPLLAREERGSIDGNAASQQAGSPALALPTSSAIPTMPTQQLDIQASIAAYPIATGHPVHMSGSDATGGMVFLQDLPDAMQLWRAQRTLMITWLVTSILSLLLFAPFFITTGLFLGAELAAVLFIMASGMHLCQRTGAGDGLELCSQIKLAATCGAAAFFLDCMTAFMDLIIVWGVDCEGDETCTSIVNYVVIFGLYLSWHAYVSISVSQRARSLLPMLNPVSSGIVQL